MEKKKINIEKKARQIEKRLPYPEVTFVSNGSYAWAEEIKSYAQEHVHEGETLNNVCFKLVSNACKRYFDFNTQIREMPWEYLFECMRVTHSGFHIFLPTIEFDSDEYPLSDDGKKRIWAWYDEKIDAIQLKNFTGKWDEEEDTSPGYDGFGRFDSYYEYIFGAIAKDGHWVVEPYTRRLTIGEINR